MGFAHKAKAETVLDLKLLHVLESWLVWTLPIHLFIVWSCAAAMQVADSSGWCTRLPWR
jgi:hypothetical protein